MSIKLRAGTPADAVACGTICYEAFKSVCSAHNFPPDFPSAEEGIGLATILLSHPGHHSVVAELDGRVVGSNFMDERALIYAIGPITVDPTVQNRGIGGQLMQQ
jgi:predicted N-acetyltransferase YhbS